MEDILKQDQRFPSQQISSFLKRSKKGKVSSKQSSNNKKLKRKKKLEDISSQISLDLKYENFEQETEYFYPQIYRKESIISIKNVSLLEQSHFRFLVNQNSDIFEHYTQYKQNNFKNIAWNDIDFIYFYCNDNYSCPICLESNLCCSIIIECGHVFCFPCIVSLYNYHMNVSNNKKIPNCPLCSKKIIFDNENIKIDINNNVKLCQKIQSINYNNNMKIKFNLILREKKSPTLYNLVYDPLLDNWKNNFKTKMRDIPDEQTKELNFSRIVSSNKLFINKKLNDCKKELNILKEEFNSTSDELKKKSIYECINQIDLLLLKNKNELNNNNKENSLLNTKMKIKNNNGNLSLDNVKNNNNDETEDINYNKYFLFYQEEKGDIYYLAPFLMEILLTEYGDYNSLPVEIEGNILDIEMNQVTPKLKSEYKYLNHLRIGSIIFFVEIDINDLISSSTKKLYNEKSYERNRLRNLLKNQEKSYENFIKRRNSKLIEEEKNNSLEDSKKSLENISCPIFLGTDEELGKNEKNQNNIEEDKNINNKKGNKLKMLFMEKEKEEKEMKDKEEKDKKEKEEIEKKDKIKKEEKKVEKIKKNKMKNKKNKGGKKGKKSENHDIKDKVFNSDNEDELSF